MTQEDQLWDMVDDVHELRNAIIEFIGEEHGNTRSLTVILALAAALGTLQRAVDMGDNPHIPDSIVTDLIRMNRYDEGQRVVYL